MRAPTSGVSPQSVGLARAAVEGDLDCDARGGGITPSSAPGALALPRTDRRERVPAGRRRFLTVRNPERRRFAEPPPASLVNYDEWWR